MFKNNLSPFNPNKDKYINNNFHQNNDFQNNNNYHQSTYQYTRGLYNPNSYNKQEPPTPTTNYNPPMSPYNAPLGQLSPNISKNPTSPTAKIKMFSNTLTLNKKQQPGTTPQSQQPQQQNGQPPKQNRPFNRGAKNLILDLSESIDLKCDQVLDEQNFINNNFRKQTIQSNNNVTKQSYPKKNNVKIPLMTYGETQIDDLKCDQILDIRKNQSSEETKTHLKFNPSNNSHHLHHLSSYEVESHSANTNTHKQTPLTPNYQRKKTTVSIIGKHTDRDHLNTSSNNSLRNITPVQEKARSCISILSPYKNGKEFHHQQENNQDEHQKSYFNQSHISSENSSQEKSFEQMKKYLQRTASLLQAYKKKLDEVEEKNVFLQKQNVQLRKCLYDDGGNKPINLNQNAPTISGRYQGSR